MPAAATRSQNSARSSEFPGRKRASRISQLLNSADMPSNGTTVSAEGKSPRRSRGIARIMSGAEGGSATGRSRSLELGEGRAVDLDAEPRPIWDLDPAVFLYDWLRNDRHADRVFGLVEFQKRLDRVQARRVMRQTGDQLQRRGERDAGAPDMRVDAHAEGARHVGDLLGLGDA